MAPPFPSSTLSILECHDTSVKLDSVSACIALRDSITSVCAISYGGN
ncbi:hypothetical protein [Novosphingobium sp. PY1]|nr:hypothetical protein [Novosphingobium sp. PY1]